VPTYLDIVTDALKEIQVLAQGEVPSAADAKDGLTKLNRLFDRWSARKIMAFNVDFSVFTLTPNLSPHVIGPTGASPTFTVAQRPVTVEAAALLIQTGPSIIDVPMNIRDDAWWANNRVKNQTSSVPTDLYYSPGWPNGSLYFWPIPTAANQVRLELWTLLPGNVAQNGTFSLPPGYWDAVILNLALTMAPMYGAAAVISPELREQARLALAAVQGNNAKSPRCASKDAGMEGNSKGSRGAGGGFFNWITGGPS
jgi:hypothetical protein